MAATPSSNSGVSEVRILRSRRVPLGENAEDDSSAERPASTADVVKRTPQQLITKFFNVVSSSGRSEVNATNKTLADASMLVNTSGTPDNGLNGSFNASRSDSLFHSAFSAPASRSRNASGKQRNAVAKAMSSARRRLLVTDTPTGSPTPAVGGFSLANPSFSQPLFGRVESEGVSLTRSAEVGARPRARASRRSAVDPQAVISASRDRLERLKTWTSIENLLEEQRRELGDYVQRAKRWRMSHSRASTSLNVSFAQQVVDNVAEPEAAVPAAATAGETDETPLDEVAVERQIRQSLETDDTVLLRRQKQLDYGKHTPAYANYLASVPKVVRSEEQPRTPNKFLKLARRDWDTRVRNWRRALHQFDTDANGNSAADLSTSALTASVLDENAMDVGGATRSPQQHTKFTTTYINERSNSMSNSLLGKRRAPHTPTGKSAATAPEAVGGSPRATPRATVLHSELTQDLVRLSTVSEETVSSPAKRLRSSSLAVKK